MILPCKNSSGANQEDFLLPLANVRFHLIFSKLCNFIGSRGFSIINKGTDSISAEKSF